MQTQMLGTATILFIIGIVAEFSIYTTKSGWGKRNWLAGIALFTTGAATGIYISAAFSAAMVLFCLLQIYRTVNLLRLAEARMHTVYLHRATARTFGWLAGAQAITIGLWFLFAALPSVITGTNALIAICVSSFVASIFIIISTVSHLLRTKAAKAQPISDRDVPTVTVAIAARNETATLQQCLEAVLASDYPKLEIIVLDDCSQDHTADVIKGFAHAGVRFIQGEQPSDTWLAKNHAYQTLLEESTGQIIIYLGVDTRIHPKTLRRLVEQFTVKKVTMLSILPKRTKSGLLAAFIQPMRYWWELALPKWIIKHEPVLSTCWMANRQALIKAGGFKSVTRAIVPEEHLSTAFSKDHKYAFLRTNEEINLTTHKDFTSQWLTAVRTRYPQAHRRPEIAAIRVIIMLYFLIAPFAVFLLLLITDSSHIALILATLSIVLLIVSHLFIALVTNPVSAWLAPVNFPIVVLVDFIALHVSMYRYEFGEVIWRGRDVTTPAMHVVPHLPELTDKPR